MLNLILPQFMLLLNLAYNLPLPIKQFLLGAIGTLTYFACVKTRFIPVEDTDPEFNNFLNIRKPLPVIFFCIVGGLVPILLDTHSLLGSFLSGFTLRLILIGFYNAKNSGGEH